MVFVGILFMDCELLEGKLLTRLWVNPVVHVQDSLVVALVWALGCVKNVWDKT